jgi:hypothetical protein
VMTAEEVQAVIVDHYRSESQTLAGAAGWNLAKWRTVVGLEAADNVELAGLRGRWKDAQAAEDPVTSVVSALRSIEAALRGPDDDAKRLVED